MKCLTCGEPATTKALVGFTGVGEYKGSQYEVTCFSFPACKSCIKDGKWLVGRVNNLMGLWFMLAVGVLCAAFGLQWNIEPPYDLSNKLFLKAIASVGALLFVLIYVVCEQLSYFKVTKRLFSGPLNAEIERHRDELYNLAVMLFRTEDDEHIQRMVSRRDARVISCDHLEP